MPWKAEFEEGLILELHRIAKIPQELAAVENGEETFAQSWARKWEGLQAEKRRNLDVRKLEPATPTENHAADPLGPKILKLRIPDQKIVESEPAANDWQITMGEKVYRLYEELKCLRNLAKGGKNESLLRRDHKEFELVWREINESRCLEAERRIAFFDSLSTAQADGLYDFIGRLYGTGAGNVKLWRVEYRKTLPPSKKRKRSPKKRRLTLTPRSKTS